MCWCVLGINIILFTISLYIFPKKPINVSTLFLGLWGIIIFLSCLNLYDIDKPSDTTYLLLLCMLLFFFLGNILGNITPILKFEINISIFSHKKEIKYGVFFALTILIFGTLFASCFKTIRYIVGGVPLWQIRNWTLSAYGSNNPFTTDRTFFRQCVSVLIEIPFQAVFYPFVAYYFLSPKKNKHRLFLLVISIIYLLVSSIISGGGRLGVVCYCFYFIFAFVILSNQSTLNKFKKVKYRRFIILFGILGFIIVICFSILRNGVGTFLREVYTYFALPPTLLDKWMPELKSGEYTYGLLTFFGLHSYFFRALESMGLNSLVPNIYGIVYRWILNAELWKNVGGVYRNAFVTPIFYFYKDGGVFLVCVFSFLFGIISEILNRKFTKMNNVGSFVLYSLLMYGVLVSFMRIQTCIPSYFISFIMAHYLFDSSYRQEDKI